MVTSITRITANLRRTGPKTRVYFVGDGVVEGQEIKFTYCNPTYGTTETWTGTIKATGGKCSAMLTYDNEATSCTSISSLEGDDLATVSVTLGGEDVGTQQVIIDGPYVIDSP